MLSATMEGTARRPWPGRTLFRAAALGIALFVLVRTLSRTDLPGAASLIARSGPAVLVGLFPFALTMGIDVLVQKRLLGALGQSARYRSLYFVRLVTEALSTSLPAGVVLAESVGPVLLQRHAGVAIDDAIVANSTKRWLTVRAHSVYIALSAVLGYATLTRVSPVMWSGQSLAWLVGALAIVLFSVSVAIGALLSGRAWPQRAARRLRSLPIARLREWLDQSQDKVAAIDHRFARLTRDKRTLASATMMLLVAWMVESLETWLILRLLGVQLGFAEVIAFEAVLSLVRSAVFFVPAGLGVQDLGYIAFLGALALPGAATLGAAFVALKRAKEGVWIIVGWLLAGALTMSRARFIAHPVALSEGALP